MDMSLLSLLINLSCPCWIKTLKVLRIFFFYRLQNFWTVVYVMCTMLQHVVIWTVILYQVWRQQTNQMCTWNMLHLKLNVLKLASVFHFQGAEFKGFDVQDENSSAPVRAGRSACKRKCVFRCKLSWESLKVCCFIVCMAFYLKFIPYNLKNITILYNRASLQALQNKECWHS